ncbi:unnamed protein product [Natator depressus]
MLIAQEAITHQKTRPRCGSLTVGLDYPSRMKRLAQFSSSSSGLLKRNTSSSTRNKRAARRGVNHKGENHKGEGNIVLCLGSEIPQVVISFSEKGALWGDDTPKGRKQHQQR